VIFYAANFVNLLSDNANIVVCFRFPILVTISTTKCDFFCRKFCQFSVIDAFTNYGGNCFAISCSSTMPILKLFWIIILLFWNYSRIGIVDEHRVYVLIIPIYGNNINKKFLIMFCFVLGKTTFQMLPPPCHNLIIKDICFGLVRHIMLRDLVTQKCSQNFLVTDFGYPRACRFRKHQI
jgi:hypothetical protein